MESVLIERLTKLVERLCLYYMIYEYTLPLLSLLYKDDLRSMLSYTKLDRASTMIKKALKDKKIYTEITLDGVYINDNEAIALGEALKNNQHLRILNLNYNSFGYTGLDAILKALINNHQFISLSLSNNKLDEKSIDIIVQYLEHDSHLTMLYLANNNIGDNGTILLANAILHNKYLTELCLAANKIEDQGAIALANMLQYNKVLIHLSLGSNIITDKGGVILANNLDNLTYLDLSSNNIGDETIIKIANTLQYNRLNRLNLRGTDAKDAGINALAKALLHNKYLRYFDINSFHMEDNNPTRMINAIRYNKSLLSCAIYGKNYPYLSMDNKLSINRLNIEIRKTDLYTLVTHVTHITSTRRGTTITLDILRTHINNSSIQQYYIINI